MRAKVTCLLDLLEPRMTIEEDATKKIESALVIDHVMMNPAEPTTVNGDNLEADEVVAFGAAILGATVVEMEDDRVLTGIDRALIAIDQVSTAIDQALTGIGVQGLTVVQALTVIAVQALAVEVALTEEIENRLPGVEMTKKVVLGRATLGLEIAAKVDLEIDAKAIDVVDLDHAIRDLDPAIQALDPAIQELDLLNIGRSN